MTVPNVEKVRYVSTTWSKVLMAVSLLAIPVAIVWGIDKRPPPVNVTANILAPLEARSFRVIDGDTLALNIRLADIDTPELRGKCERERALAKLAMEFTRGFLAEGPDMVTTEGVGKYGRVIAKVESLIRPDDTDVGDALVAQGLARLWPPKPGETWCPAPSP